VNFRLRGYLAVTPKPGFPENVRKELQLGEDLAPDDNRVQCSKLHISYLLTECRLAGRMASQVHYSN